MIHNIYIFEIIYEINQKDISSFTKALTAEMNITQKLIINFNILLNSYEVYYSDWWWG